MASRPPNAIADGVDMSQRIRDGAGLAATTLPGGKRPVEFVVRYTSPNTTNNPGKQLTDADIATCRQHRLSLVLVHETTARRALAGYAAGQQDATDAEAFVISKGMPDGTVIHGAIDFDAAGPDVEAYVRGFRDQLGLARTGMYGGRRPLRYLLDAGLITYAWQTYAWSGGLWTPGITAAQWANGEIVAGNSVDYDSACAPDYGQLGPGWTSTDRGIDVTQPGDVWTWKPSPPWQNAADETAFGQLAEARNNAIAAAKAVTALAGKVDLLAGKLDALSTKIDGLSGATPGTGVSATLLAAAERAAADVLDPHAGI